MRKYEGLFIFPPEEAQEASKGEESRLEETITRFGGRVVERHDWGRRPLGFPIRRFREGRFLLWNFEMEGPQLGEFRKALELNEKLLKSMIVKPHEPKPVKETKKRQRAPREQARESWPRRAGEERTHASQS